jgi:hypothetical protein
VKSAKITALGIREATLVGLSLEVVGPGDRDLKPANIFLARRRAGEIATVLAPALLLAFESAVLARTDAVAPRSSSGR